MDSIRRGHAEISGENALHLTRVLRVAPGEKFEISDNSGVYLAQVESARKDFVSFAVMETIETPPAVVETTLLVALTKFDRFEWTLEKATEVGAARIVPVVAERSEKGLDRAAEKRFDRWLRITREASEQARRARLPELEPVADLAAALQTSADHRYVLDEGESRPIVSTLPSAAKSSDVVALLVGPEGGWTDRERAAMAAAGWTAVSLGETILRSETAAVAGLAIIRSWWAAKST